MTEVVAALQRLLGSEAVGIGEADLDRHAHDWTPRALLARRAGQGWARPRCVVRPMSTEQVATLLAWADAQRCPVVPFGGGSGVCGAIAPHNAVVIDLGAMNSMSDVDEKSLLATAQAGVTGPALQAHLEGNGFALGHEPQSIAISTVGGWVATRACGQLSARHGGIEDMIAGLEAVLPGGRVVRSKVSPRRATGPDVAALLIGSEGTLGVVTEATLRVARRAEGRADACVRFEHMTDGVAACRSLAQSELRPTLVRLYDADDATLFLRHHPDESPGVLLLLSFDGNDADARSQRASALAGGAEGNHALVAHWWEHRNDAVDEFRRVMAGEGPLGPHAVVDTMEVSGTWSVLRELYHSMKGALSQKAMLAGCHLSHVYPDGACLYFTLGSACADDDEAAAVLESWWETGMSACLKAGGSISHHHGIGRLKARWLPQEVGGWWDVLVAVKRAIDPNGIMNPGALGL